MTVVSLKIDAGELVPQTEILEQPLVKIGLSDGSSVSIKPCYLHDYCENPAGWEVGKELSSAEEEALRFAASCYRAERAGKRLIARAEQNSTGLTRKLELRGYGSACVSAVVSYLISLDMVNDGRFAERWLKARLVRKAGKTPGPRRLKSMLMSRGISWDDAGAALEKVLDDEAEWDLLQSFVKKTGTGGAYRLRAQLRYEGFSPSVLNRFFEE
jgi:regulatory protein